MRRWITVCLAVALCICLAAPALATDGESVWSKYNMKLWGRVKMDYHVDDARFDPYNDFMGTVADSRNKADWDNDSTNFNPRDTRFGWSSSHTAGDYAAKAVFEIDFYGTNAGNNLIPRMRLGYVDIANKNTGTSIRAGQDWIPISRLNPSMIDFGILTAAGNLWWRVPQLVVRQDIQDFNVMVGVMRHRRTDTAAETRMPWVMARVGYDFALFGSNHMLAVGGGYQSDDAAGGKSLDRMVVCLEAKFTLGPFLLKGEGWWGEGIGGHWLRYDMDTFIDRDGSTQEIEARGGWVDLTYKVLPVWSLTAGIGVDDPKDSDYNRLSGNIDRKFTRNLSYFFNTWYSLSDGLKIGAEWVRVETTRKDLAGDHFTDNGNRFTMSVFYHF
jgi:hypothetical protein